MDISLIKPGEIVKVIHPDSYRYARNYMYVVWPRKLKYEYSEKTWRGVVKYYETKTPFIVDLEGELRENSSFGYNTKCEVEKITLKEYREISKLLQKCGLRYNKKLNKITYKKNKKHESHW